MTTRCKDGGFAIIEHDVDSCAANIGRIVRVKAPAVIDKAGHLTWLIQPVGDEPYMVCNHAGEFDGFMVFGNNNIEHQDGWMRPISECDVEFEGISRASESVPGFGQVSRLGQHERQYGVSFFLKHTYVAPRPHYPSPLTQPDPLVLKIADPASARQLAGKGVKGTVE